MLIKASLAATDSEMKTYFWERKGDMAPFTKRESSTGSKSSERN